MLPWLAAAAVESINNKDSAKLNHIIALITIVDIHIGLDKMMNFRPSTVQGT
jgi:hypothetical protein